MKRIIALVLTLFTVFAFFCACSSDKGEDASSQHIMIKDDTGSTIADTNNGDNVVIDNKTGEIKITDRNGNETTIDTNKTPATVITGDGDNSTSSVINGPYEETESGVSSQHQTSSDSSSAPPAQESSSDPISTAPSEIYGIESAEDWL